MKHQSLGSVKGKTPRKGRAERRRYSLVLIGTGHARLLNQPRSTRTFVLVKLLARTTSILGESLVGLTVLSEMSFGVGLCKMDDTE